MRKLAFLAVITFAASAAAQDTPVMTPDGCVKTASDWFNHAYQAARDSAAMPGGKPADARGLLAQRLDRIKGCAAQFSVAGTSGASLLQLATLYTTIGNDSLAAAAVQKRLAEPSLSASAKADALAALVAVYTKPDTVLIQRAEPFMKELDAMPGMVPQRIAAHARLNGEYRYLDVDSRIEEHSRAIIGLAKGIKLAPLSQVARDPGAVDAFTVLVAYTDLAEVYGDMGKVDSALMVLDQAGRDHPEVTPDDASRILQPERERYELVGTVAPPVAADHWLNAPGSTRTFDPKGNVMLIEFTAHWCVPCRNSYPSMVEMASRFEPQGVKFLFATQFYGYLGTSGPLDPPAEFAADHSYYVDEHDITFPVAVADQPVRKLATDPYLPNPNDAAYKVGGIPQIVVIDKHGVIRRIVTGWDAGNAVRLSVLMDELLKETDARHPL